MKIKSTPEQSAIVLSKAALLIVKAFAGTGKTTTLVEYAAARPKARILYLAYNKAMEVAASGKFPRNVICKTVHALAFGQFGRRYSEAGKLGNVRGSDVMMALDLDPLTSKHVLETVNNFIYSADREITVDHVPSSIAGHRRMPLVDGAKRLWAAMRDIPEADDGKPFIKMTHDGYLKLFQLFRPNLSSKFDIILLDEAQDSNPVTADIVMNQPCVRVLVGDSHQAIYGFRKSTDALETAALLPGAEVKYLTHSFRFGPDVATLATALLAGFKEERLPLIGRGPQHALATKVDRTKPYSTICRTNAVVFSTAAELLGKSKLHFIGGVDSYPFERLVDVQNLAAGQVHLVKDPFFKKMGSIYKLQEYADAVSDVEILGLLKVQKEYGPRIPGLVERIRQEAVADIKAGQVLLTTAHRSKGLEFDQVLLADDFEVFVDEDGVPIELDTRELVEELNLLYVASTRAIHALEFNSSVKDALAALGKDPAFMLPEGTAPSALVQRLLGAPHVQRQGAVQFEDDAEDAAFDAGVAEVLSHISRGPTPEPEPEIAEAVVAAETSAPAPQRDAPKPWRVRSWQR